MFRRYMNVRYHAAIMRLHVNMLFLDARVSNIVIQADFKFVLVNAGMCICALR